jgi:hypothetical protein
LAEIIEEKYDDHFTVWYGSVDIVCEKESMNDVVNYTHQFMGRDVIMRLEDGRSMTVRFSGSGVQQQSVVEDGVAPSNHVQCYFVSITPLLDLEKALTDPGSFFSKL